MRSPSPAAPVSCWSPSTSPPPAGGGEVLPGASEQNIDLLVPLPKVVEEFFRHRQEYGYIMRLGSHVFFHGLAVGETNKVNIADGKTLVIKYLGLGEVDKEGMRTVSFELNGIRRDVQVPDEEAQKNIVKVPMADPEDKSQVGSSIPGAVSRLNVKVGDTVEKNQTLVTIEAMKMETAITARMSGDGVGDPGEGGRDRQGRPAHLGHQISIRGRRPAPVGPPFGISERWDGKMKVVQIGLAEILKNCKKNLVK